MKLAFSGEAKYTDFTSAYQLYLRRERKGSPVDEKMYRRILKAFCRRLADMLKEQGMIDLPSSLGTISVANIRRVLMYRNGKPDGFGSMNWKTGRRDGKLKSFGMVFLPRHENGCLRGYGFVANRRLFQEMKAMYNGEDCPWTPIEFNDEMI